MKTFYFIFFVLVVLQLPIAVAEDQSSVQLRGDGEPAPGVTAPQVTQDQSDLIQTTPKQYVDRGTLAHFADEHLKNCDAFMEIKQYERAMKECNLAIGFVEYDQSQRQSLSYLGFEAYLKRGDFYMRRKEYKRAADDYCIASAFHESKPKAYPSVYTRLGEAYFFAGNYAKAADEYMVSLSGGPPDRSIYFNLEFIFDGCFRYPAPFERAAHRAEVLYRTGNVEDSAKLFHSLVIAYGKYLQTRPYSSDTESQEFLNYIQYRNVPYSASKPDGPPYNRGAATPLAATGSEDLAPSTVPVPSTTRNDGDDWRTALSTPLVSRSEQRSSSRNTSLNSSKTQHKLSDSFNNFHGYYCPAVLVSPMKDNAVYTPVGLGVVTSYAGFGINPITDEEEFNNGIDLAARLNDRVYNLMDGFVTRTGWLNKTLGVSVEIYHPYPNVRTTYGHLNAYSVVPGQWVKRGQVVGFAGSTGKSDGVTVHYTVINEDTKQYIEPMAFLAKVPDYVAALKKARVQSELAQNTQKHKEELANAKGNHQVGWLWCVLVLVGMSGLFALCYYLWQYCKKKFENKFGKGNFEGFAAGIFLVILGTFFLLYGTMFNAYECVECSHQSSKCIITTKNIFNQVVSRKEFDLRQITGLSIESHTSSSHTYYRLVATVKGERVEIPTNESESVDKQKATFDEFLKSRNMPDYGWNQCHTDMAWLGLIPLGLGLFLLIAAVNLAEPIVAIISKFLTGLLRLLGVDKLIKLAEPIFIAASRFLERLLEWLRISWFLILMLSICLVPLVLMSWIYISGLHWLVSPERNEHYAEAAAYKKGDFIGAAKLLSTQIEMQSKEGAPVDYLTYMHLARTLAKLNMNQQSSSLLGKAADVATDQNLLLMDSADVYRIQKNYVKSIALLNQLLNAEPSSREMKKVSSLNALHKAMNKKTEDPKNPIAIALRNLVHNKDEDFSNKVLKFDTTDFMKTHFFDFMNVPFIKSEKIEKRKLITHKMYAYDQMSQIYHEAGDDYNMANCLEQALRVSNEGNLYCESITYANTLADYYEETGNLECALAVRKQVPDWQKKFDEQEAAKKAQEDN